MLYGLDRYSEDLDFSLLKKGDGFDLADYSESLKRELASFGFAVEIESRKKKAQTAVQSAFLKTDTRTQMITVEFERGLVQQVPRNQVLKIKKARRVPVVLGMFEGELPRVPSKGWAEMIRAGPPDQPPACWPGTPDLRHDIRLAPECPPFCDGNG